MTNITQARNIFLPWLWGVTPNDSTTHKCSSSLSILLTYFAVNCLTALLGIGLSHRTVVNKLSCGWLGRDQSTSWRWMWMVQLGLHFGADVVVAYITTHATGYNQEIRPRTWDLALFYASRPRMAWICLSYLGTYKLKRRNRPTSPTTESERARPADTELPAQGRPESVRSLANSLDPEGGDKLEMIELAPAIHESPGDAENNAQMQEAAPVGNPADVERLAGVQDEGPVEGHWTSAAKQTLIVEAIMQVVGSYYLGRTAHFATTHGHYLPDRHYDPNARLMYGGALLTLITTYLSLAGIFMEVYQLVTREPFTDGGFPRIVELISSLSTSPPTEGGTQPAEPSQQEHTRQPSTLRNFVFTLGYVTYIGTWLILRNLAFTLGYVTYIGTWLFWSGYVKLAAEMYVVPTPHLNALENPQEALR